MNLLGFSWSTDKRHFGIAGPWICILDPETLDSVLRFRTKTHKIVAIYINCTKYCVFSDRDLRKSSSGVQHFRVQSPCPGSSDSQMPQQTAMQMIAILSAVLIEVILTMGGAGLKIGRNLPMKFCDSPYWAGLKFYDSPNFDGSEFSDSLIQGMQCILYVIPYIAVHLRYGVIYFNRF